MLYPKEDKAAKVLLYACRNCEHSEPALNPCIYVNKILHEVDELTQIVADVIHDPTLPKTEEHPCPRCAHKEAVFFQVPRLFTQRSDQCHGPPSPPSATGLSQTDTHCGTNMNLGIEMKIPERARTELERQSSSESRSEGGGKPEMSFPESHWPRKH